jgi:DNA ligase (NAD+)
MAYKFRGESAKAEINFISWSVSRNGILTPVANIKPVELSGAKISRVTLHNLGMVNQFKLKAGDIIEIVRSGEVIPKFLSVVESSPAEFVVPQQCPSCSSQVEKNGIRLFCINKECPAQKLENILNFVQKIGMNDLSSKRLEQMLQVGLVKDISDLYKIKRNDLLKLDKTKDKLADKILNEIEKSKAANLITFLSALGIPGGAYNKCEKVVKAGFDSIEKILSLTIDQLCSIDGFATKSAEDFVTGIQDRTVLIRALINSGFDLKNIVLEDSLCFCITGSLEEKRTVIEGRIRAKGYKVVSSVTKETTHLVCNSESSSSKYKKALKLGISIISELDLRNLL